MPAPSQLRVIAAIAAYCPPVHVGADDARSVTGSSRAVLAKLVSD
jgi:hypothetical protein